MKHFHGTVTLALLEEDNQQRAIFRIIPLCTKDGFVFNAKAADFPDHGSLRIVPDKREQGTFKERMRAMGNLCVVQLSEEGKEIAKVRQNRNYDPEQGECNRFAVYSDVICAFEPGGIFEVYDENADFSAALSPRVLLRRGMVLCGPVDREDTSRSGELRPFGNDNYLLSTMRLPDETERTFYWNPEDILSWRRHRSGMRSEKKRQGSLEKAPDKKGDIDAPCSGVVAVLPNEPSETSTAAAPKKAERKIRRAMAVLPASAIKGSGLKETKEPPQTLVPEKGAKVRVVYAPGGSGATREQALPVAEYSAGAGEGAPFAHVGAKAKEPLRAESSLAHVVEKQIRADARGTKANDAFAYVDNPVEGLTAALESCWQQPEARNRAIQVLYGNTAFAKAFLEHARAHGCRMDAVAAARAQTEELEVERLRVLVQLDALNAGIRKAQDAMLVEVGQKKKEELIRLRDQIQAAKAETEKLNHALSMLGNRAQAQTLALFAQNASLFCGCEGTQVMLSPLVGVRREPDEMLAAIQKVMRAKGFACTKEAAAELLLHFALEEEFCLCAATLKDAERCAEALMQALGLQGVSACIGGGSSFCLASLLPDNGLRTPTVGVCPIDCASLRVHGHKTIRIIDESTMMPAHEPSAVVFVPKPCACEGEEQSAFPPTSLESLDIGRWGTRPMAQEAEAWFCALENSLKEQDIRIPHTVLHRMRAFIEVALSCFASGFLPSADAAVLAWLMPMLYYRGMDAETFRKEIGCLPRCIAALEASGGR